jgi:NMD protein affecting ribosome stability and mRNA decay
MAICAECGTDTELHELGVPICTSCISKRESLNPLLAGLSVEITHSRDLYFKAMQELAPYQAPGQRLAKGSRHRSEAMRLEDRAKIAGEKYWEALRRYGETLRRETGKSRSA